MLETGELIYYETKRKSDVLFVEPLQRKHRQQHLTYIRSKVRISEDNLAEAFTTLPGFQVGR